MAKKSKYKKPINAKSTTYRGYKLKSGLEKYMLQLFKDNGIPFSYEGRKFVIIDSFDSPNDSYEKFLNGKGEFKNRGNKHIKDMIYTPDFTNPVNEPLKFICETKGRAMCDFSRTWKLMKKYLVDNNMEDVVLFVPRTQKDCREVIRIIKDKF